MTDPAQAPAFSIQRVYLKDLSVEIPNAPRIFLETQQPNVEIQMDVGSEICQRAPTERACGRTSESRGVRTPSSSARNKRNKGGS